MDEANPWEVYANDEDLALMVCCRKARRSKVNWSAFEKGVTALWSHDAMMVFAGLGMISGSRASEAAWSSSTNIISPVEYDSSHRLLSLLNFIFLWHWEPSNSSLDTLLQYWDDGIYTPLISCYAPYSVPYIAESQDYGNLDRLLYSLASFSLFARSATF